jgi:hypothetical protein
MGLGVIILSFLEFYEIMPYKLIIMDLYFYNSDMIPEYLIKVERLAGVMGNANATAILLVSTMPYTLLIIGNANSRLIKKILCIMYLFVVLYVLVVMTASRTSIFVSLLILVLILFAASRRLKEAFLAVSIMIILTATGIYLYHRFESEIIVQDRITKTFQGKEDFQLSAEGVAKWANRNEMWQERFKTFQNEGNQLAILLGLGYTKAYKDFADNGLISTFINDGLTGLILKLFLFYIFIKFGLMRAIRYFRRFEIDFPCLAFSISAFSLLLWELTGDLTEHYKLGQLFYLFLSIAMIINGKIFSKKRG